MIVASSTSYERRREQRPEITVQEAILLEESLNGEVISHFRETVSERTGFEKCNGHRVWPVFGSADGSMFDYDGDAYHLSTHH